jgi:inosose dehydratase
MGDAGSGLPARAGGPSSPASPMLSRIAGAPISWGVCEAPGWGHQLSVDEVLTSMRSLGLTATEFGPDGFLAEEPAARAEQLRGYGMTAVGGFVPILLHEEARDPLPEAGRFIDACLEAGATCMVVAAATGAEGYADRPVLTTAGWSTLVANLDRLDEHARSRGVQASLHPHVGTMVERRSDVDRVLAESAIGLCLDTGHLTIGGSDPVALAAELGDRIVHVHLKDVDSALADRVRSGDLAFADAVRAGLFRPLGSGHIDIASLVRSLEAQAYSGWYVLEQDVMLNASTDGGGPTGAASVTDVSPEDNVRESLGFLRGVAS